MFHNFIIFLTLLLNCLNLVFADGVLGCGGFVKSDVEINFSLVEVINRKQAKWVGSGLFTVALHALN